MSTRSSPALRSRLRQAAAGFTLLESVVVILMLGILGAYVTPKVFNSSDMTLDAQAKVLASHLQRAQLLAMTTGNSVSLCAQSAAYFVQMGAICPSALPAQTSLAQPVLVTLDNNASFASNSTAIVFDSLGQPNGAGNLQIRTASNTRSFTIATAAVTGLVSVSSP